MNRSMKLVVFGVGVISAAMCCLVVDSVDAQDRARQPYKLLQSASDIAALPKANDNERQQTVRAGFAPRQSASSQSGYQGSFYLQGNGKEQVYPYPASNQPRQSAASQSAYALSQGSTTGRLSNQISLGSNTTTGNLRPERFANNEPFANRFAVDREPVTQQSSSTLNPAEQAKINQAAVERFRAQRAQYQAQQTRLAQAQAANAQASARVASNSQVYRQTAYQAANPNARLAQNCNCAPNYNPTAAGYQAAFQAPAINPNVGAGIGLGLNTPPANTQGFNPAALPNQACQTGCQPCGVGSYTGYQPGGYQQGAYQQGGFGGIGTPQFGAQGARWWTPFIRGSGVYTPLIRLVQNNAGTYLGQGIIGQPTAYVNGQPLRNLLRYIAP